MSATDYATLVYNQLYALLDGYGGYTALVKAGNELKTTTRRIQKYANNQFADTPTILLDFAEGDEDIYKPTEDYGYNYQQIPNAWIEQWLYTYAVVITQQNADVQSANQLCTQITEALRRGGPQLGLPYVCRWGPLKRRDVVNSKDPAAVGSYVRVSRIYIPVQLQINGQQLAE